MATKTISIDIEAYKRLKSVQQKTESFSQTIKRVIQKPIDFDLWMAAIEQDPLSAQAAAAVDKVVSQRRHNRNRDRAPGRNQR